jgi:hypothetical protein
MKLETKLKKWKNREKNNEKDREDRRFPRELGVAPTKK